MISNFQWKGEGWDIGVPYCQAYCSAEDSHLRQCAYGNGYEIISCLVLLT